MITIIGDKLDIKNPMIYDQWTDRQSCHMQKNQLKNHLKKRSN